MARQSPKLGFSQDRLTPSPFPALENAHDGQPDVQERQVRRHATGRTGGRIPRPRAQPGSSVPPPPQEAACVVHPQGAPKPFCSHCPLDTPRRGSPRGRWESFHSRRSPDPAQTALTYLQPAPDGPAPCQPAGHSLSQRGGGDSFRTGAQVARPVSPGCRQHTARGRGCQLHQLQLSCPAGAPVLCQALAWAELAGLTAMPAPRDPSLLPPRHMCTRTLTYTDTNTCLHKYMPSPAHMHAVCILTGNYTSAHTHMHTHLHIYPCTHTHT